MRKMLRIAPQDNVAVALSPLEANEEIDGICLAENIPMGHKIAVSFIHEGEKIIKYGFPIGYATRDIPTGSHVHTHNVHTLLNGELEYTYTPGCPKIQPEKPQEFMGYVRHDGRVGIRNELRIIPTVGCVNDIARALETAGQSLVGNGVDHVYAFTHPYGCSQMTEDQENTRRILAAMATHPNVGGVLVLGLGCENSGIERIQEHMGNWDSSRVRFLVCQKSEDEFADGMKLLAELACRMKEDRRTPCTADKLVVGLKCGGSDGLSGITANPVIGGFSDILTSQGGTTILTEVPEMFGAETILMNRCQSEEVFHKCVDMINGFKHYFKQNNQEIYENPSPGNKEGGISTLEDKALGCTQKSGFSPVVDVLSYGQRFSRNGLNLLTAPGNDLVAATALACSGAQLVLFSTGRGTPFACPVPTVKISTNTPLAEKKPGWIDFNAGRLLDQDETIPSLARQLMDFVLSVSSGAEILSEKRGFHDFAIFKTGVTL